MAIIIRDNSSVYYDGGSLPRDARANRTLPVNPNIQYSGGTLPADDRSPVPFVDKLNTPGVITLSSPAQEVTLPPDTKISLHGEKHIVLTPILDGEDGTAVFEHINRKPYEISFEGTFRMQNKGGTNYENTTPPAGLSGPINNVFPQEYLNKVWYYIFLPNTVLKINNSYLNGLGILQVVIRAFTPSLVHGSKNVPYHMTAYENKPGQSLIIK